MNATWSLDALYKGYDDPAFHHDMDTLKAVVKKINDLSGQLHHDRRAECVTAMLKQQETLYELSGRLGSYISLRQSCDTTNTQTVALMGQLQQTLSECAKSFARFDTFIQGINDLNTLIAQNPFLSEYAYLLRETKQDGKYRLSDDVEEVIAKLNISAGDAWANLQEYLTSTLAVPYQDQTLTLSEVRSLAYDQDPSVRKAAYDAELKAYEPIRQSVAFALNNIKSQVNTISDLRGFASPLDMTLYYSRMERKTLDAMMEAIQAYLPMFHHYLKRKAEILGHHNGLPWYDLFAPICDVDHSDKKYTPMEAKQYLIDHFAAFSQDLCTMIETAFHDDWIDFYPRKGKVGGAFCANLPFIKQSRILTNFNGQLDDIITLAHELGHAYHGMMIENHRPLNTDYSMPVAETASTFNENIIMNAAIAEESNTRKKLVLIEKQLQDLTQIICDIYSRYHFECEVFERRRTTFLFAEDLCNIMLQTQKEAYGDALDFHYLHPYMWINKSHYYSASLSFYNFPYAFGGLFARGLIVQYQKQGSSFVDQYRLLLKATTIAHVEDIAKKVGIDIGDPSFWRESLETCKNRIDEFMTLSQSLS